MRLLLIAAFVAVALAGCTGDAPADDSPSETTPTGTPTLEREAVTVAIGTVGAFPLTEGPLAFGYDTGRIEVSQNATVTLTFSNNDMNPSVNHDWYLPHLEAQTATIAPGGSDTITFDVDLPPGEYPFWCSIGSHRDQGMEGVLVVV